jgi:phosphatidate phosphatase APP1
MTASPRAPQSARSRAVSIAYAAETALRSGMIALAERVGWRPALLPYSGYADGDSARILARVVLAPASVDPAARRGIAAWRRLLTLECPATEVRIELGGTTTVVTTDDAGLVDTTVALEHPLEPGTAGALLRVDGRVPARVPVHVVTTGRGVICDIDDTVWVTGIGHPIEAARRTLFGTSSTRQAVPGMSELIREAAGRQHGAAVVYLSNGPWNFAGIASRFLRKRGFPAGTLLMTDWGITRTRWFRDGQEHKRSELARLRDDLPNVSWVLVGDDGEHDPELYETFTREHPTAVDAIALRQVRPDAVGGDETSHVDGVPVLRGRDGNALLPRLRSVLG